MVALVASCCLGAAALPTESIAGPAVESDSTVGGARVHQEINFWDPEIHYWIHVHGASGVSPFCVTLRLEKRVDGDWQGIGIDSRQRRGVKECCPTPHQGETCGSSATDSYWDLFLYPQGRLLRKVRHGRLRIHGFTDLGPSLALRLDGPAR